MTGDEGGDRGRGDGTKGVDSAGVSTGNFTVPVAAVSSTRVTVFVTPGGICEICLAVSESLMTWRS